MREWEQMRRRGFFGGSDLQTGSACSSRTSEDAKRKTSFTVGGKPNTVGPTPFQWGGAGMRNPAQETDYEYSGPLAKQPHESVESHEPVLPGYRTPGSTDSAPLNQPVRVGLFAVQL